MSRPQAEDLEDGTKLEIWKLRRDRFDSQNNLISRFILTTVGRVVMNLPSLILYLKRNL